MFVDSTKKCEIHDWRIKDNTRKKEEPSLRNKCEIYSHHVRWTKGTECPETSEVTASSFLVSVNIN